MPTPPGRRCRVPGRFLANYEAGLDAALCIASSLFKRLHSGQGEFSTSRNRPCLSRADCILADSSPVRFQRTETVAITTNRARRPSSCTDGFVYLYMTSRAHWLGVKALMGQPDWLDAFDDDWLEFSVTSKGSRLFNGFRGWVRDLPKHAAAEKAQRLNVPLVPVNDAADLHHSPQYRHRGFFRQVRHPVLGNASVSHGSVRAQRIASRNYLCCTNSRAAHRTRPGPGGSPAHTADGEVGAAENAQGPPRWPPEGVRVVEPRRYRRVRTPASCWRCLALK